MRRLDLRSYSYPLCLPLLVAASLSASACFEDPATTDGGDGDGDTTGDGDGDSGDGDGDSGDGDGDSGDGDGDGDGGDMEPPMITSFTADGMADPASFTTATNVLLEVDASDDVGVVLVEFYDGNLKLGEDAEAPFELPWLVTSEEQGVHQLRAVASDASAKEAEAELEASVTTEAGGQRLHHNLIADTTPGSGIYGLGHGGEGSIYVAGTHNSDIWVAKYEKTGLTKVWDYAYGGQGNGSDIAHDVEVGPDGAAVFVGVEVADFDPTANGDVWLRKYSAAGDLLLDEKFDGGSDWDDVGRGVSIGLDNQIYVAAEQATSVNQFDNESLWTMSISPATGDLDYEELEGGDSETLIRLFGAALDPTGRVVVTGENVKLQPFQVQAFTRVYAPGGGGALSEVWTRVQNGPSDLDLQPRGVAAGPDGSFVVAGGVESEPGAWVRKYDADGGTVWTNQYNLGASGETPLGVAIDQNGYIALVGEANDPFAGYFVARYAPDGAEVWVVTVQEQPYGDTARAVSIDPTSGKIAVGGTSNEDDGGHRFLSVYAP